MSGVILEARPFRPFKSGEEYLYAMKEDLAEWFQILYPHLHINVDNFMDRLETGVALCEHANAVKVQATEYVQKKQARKMMTRSVTGSLAQAQQLIEITDVKFFATAKAGTFFARDNVSNFIHWCRQSLRIIECLLFETDDLILRKNEKHVILCLLEVARRGARFGMLAPMLIQMERQIDREIAADQRKLGTDVSAGTENDNEMSDESDSEIEDEQPVLMYGPLPQIVTNDLKSLDEMVRDLVEKCTCPTQFPMIRVSEGKYRIGDTKVLIFVRILRSHVMVRVGGGWDTLAHYLDKHDPCRCRSQHRTTQSARLINKPGAIDLQGAQVYYDRSPPRVPHHNINGLGINGNRDHLSAPMNSINRSRSRSPSHLTYMDSRRSISPNLQRKSLAPPSSRSRSPTPNFVSTHTTKLSKNSSPTHSRNINKNQVTAIQIDPKITMKSEATLQVSESSTDHSDNASEVSDEGYRSLGVIQNDKGKNRSSLYSQNSIEDADEAEHQSIDYEDDTNDAGLRRTQFSHIYNDPDKVAKPNKERAKSSPKLIPKFNVNTWSGRQKTPRPALNSNTFSPPPFIRNSSTRRSVNVGYEPPRRSSVSASTSPTKTRLKEELLKAVKNNNDDLTIAEQVKKLLKKYGSLTVLDGNYKTGDKDTKLFRSPRKDSKPENLISQDQNEEFNNFMHKVNEIGSIVKKLGSKDTELQKIGTIEADRYLNEKDILYENICEDTVKLTIKNDRTVINKKALRDSADQNTMSQEAFMEEVSRDADQRYKDKLRRQERADTLKTQGTKAFRRGEYERAITLYAKVIYSTFNYGVAR
ncbi:hypothetical protein FQA39_LY16642 [Lamprigera yunnana]|nr:hypothetical protein FQA39_LY16642 [Lamprigera yunnana]